MAFTAFQNLGYVGIGKQTVQGTGVAPTKFLKFQQATYLINQSVLEWRDPNQRDRTVEAKSKLGYAGAVKALCYVDELAALLTWAMGLDTKTGIADPFTHTISFADTQPYLSPEIGYYTIAPSTPTFQLIDRVIDSKITGLEISGEVGKELSVNVDFVGLNPNKQASAATITYNDGAGQGPLMFGQGVFTITGPSDAATIQAQIAKFAIKLANGMQIAEANSLIGIGIVEGARNVDLTFTLIFTGPSLYQLTYYGAVAGTAPSVTLGAGSFIVVATSQAAAPGPERSVTLTMTNINFTMGKLALSPDGKIGMMDVTAHGMRVGATQALSAVVKNGVSTAY